MYYTVAKSEWVAGRSSLTEKEARALALKFGPNASVTAEGSHASSRASEVWPELFRTTTAGRWWCPACAVMFDAKHKYENGFETVRHDCGRVVAQNLAAVRDRIPQDRHDESDPMSMPRHRLS